MTRPWPPCVPLAATRWGCDIRGLVTACRRHVVALMTQFPHAPARGPGAGDAGDADDATTTTTHTQQRRDPSGSRLFRRIPGKDYGAGGAHKPRHSDDSSSSAPTQPHADPLIRARIHLPSLPAQSLPEQQGEPLRISSVTCAPNISHVGPLTHAPTLQSARRLSNPHVDPLIRAWAAPPTLQIAGLRAT